MVLTLYANGDILNYASITDMEFSRVNRTRYTINTDDVKNKNGVYEKYKITKEGELQINTFERRTETYRYKVGLGLGFTRTRNITVPVVKKQLISDLHVEHFSIYYHYAETWISFTSGNQEFEVIRPKLYDPISTYWEEEIRVQTNKFGKEILRLGKDLIF